MARLASNKPLEGICTGVLYKMVKNPNRYGGVIRVARNCYFRTHDRKLDMCPDCGYALFWSRTGTGFLTLDELRELSEREDDILVDVVLEKGIKLEL